MKISLTKIAFTLFLFSFIAYFGCWPNEPSLIEKTYPNGVRLFDLDGRKELLTEDLLVYVSWDKLIELSHKGTAKVDTTILKNGIIKIFNSPNAIWNDFKIIDYKGKVVKYAQFTNNDSLENRFIYFNKSLYLDYVQEFLGDLETKLLLDFHNYEEYEAYYNLLGMNSMRLYGWWCDYCVHALSLDLRRDVLTLVNSYTQKPLRMLFHYGDLYASVMAAEGLIYSEYLEDEHKYRNPKSEWKWRGFSGEDSIRFNYLKNYDGNILVCGNNVSHGNFEVPVKLIFSDSAIAEIPRNFKSIK